MTEYAQERVEIVNWARKWRAVVDDLAELCEIFFKIASWTLVSAAIEVVRIKTNDEILFWVWLFIITLMPIYAASQGFRFYFSVYGSDEILKLPALPAHKKGKIAGVFLALMLGSLVLLFFGVVVFASHSISEAIVHSQLFPNDVSSSHHPPPPIPPPFH